jgi:hypothetical protein
VKLFRYGLLFIVLLNAWTSAQPPEKLAAVYRAGKVVGVASQANLSGADARRRFGRAVSALAREIKIVQGLVTVPAEKDILAAYSLAQRKFEKAATNLELFDAMEEKSSQVDALAGAVPATRGGVEGKTEILDTMHRQGQQAANEGRLALATAATALREGRENLAKAERAYLTAGPETPPVSAKPPRE